MGGWGLKFLYIIGRCMLTPLFYDEPSLLPTLSFFKFCPTFSYHLQPPPPLFFLLSCFFGSMGDCSTFDVLFYFNNNMDLHMMSLGILDLDACFMQQGVKFTKVWDVMLFFTGTLVWHHTQTHNHTPQHTPGPVDWHTHININIYLYHPLCAHNSYLYYIKWLNE